MTAVVRGVWNTPRNVWNIPETASVTSGRSIGLERCVEQLRVDAVFRAVQAETMRLRSLPRQVLFCIDAVSLQRLYG